MKLFFFDDSPDRRPIIALRRLKWFTMAKKISEGPGSVRHWVTLILTAVFQGILESDYLSPTLDNLTTSYFFIQSFMLV